MILLDNIDFDTVLIVIGTLYSTCIRLFLLVSDMEDRHNYSDRHKSCTFFLEFFLSAPWGRGANFGTGRFCVIENSISQNQLVPKLVRLPQGATKKF